MDLTNIEVDKFTITKLVDESNLIYLINNRYYTDLICCVFTHWPVVGQSGKVIWIQQGFMKIPVFQQDKESIPLSILMQPADYNTHKSFVEFLKRPDFAKTTNTITGSYFSAFEANF